jgi:hypothetical protein
MRRRPARHNGRTGRFSFDVSETLTDSAASQNARNFAKREPAQPLILVSN